MLLYRGWTYSFSQADKKPAGFSRLHGRCLHTRLRSYRLRFTIMLPYVQ